MKKAFWVSHFTPDSGANETVSSVSNKQFLQYKLNGIQLLMYVLFIPIVWFTFQYKFMYYAQFLSFSIKCLIMPHTTLYLIHYKLK